MCFQCLMRASRFKLIEEHTLTSHTQWIKELLCQWNRRREENAHPLCVPTKEANRLWYRWSSLQAQLEVIYSIHIKTQSHFPAPHSDSSGGPFQKSNGGCDGMKEGHGVKGYKERKGARQEETGWEVAGEQNGGGGVRARGDWSAERWRKIFLSQSICTWEQFVPNFGSLIIVLKCVHTYTDTHSTSSSICRVWRELDTRMMSSGKAAGVFEEIPSSPPLCTLDSGGPLISSTASMCVCVCVCDPSSSIFFFPLL